MGTVKIKYGSVFIRLKDNPDHFIHFEGDNPENPKAEVIYRAKPGCIGAAVFVEKKALRFIKESGANNLETVDARQVMKEQEEKGES